MWTYQQALQWLYARQSLGIKLGLDKVRRLLAAVGDPQDDFDAIHVAGTNGKGTVTWLIAASLSAAGQRTGRFTSPHLVSFRERIAVDGQLIPAKDVARILASLRPHVEDLDATDEPPTFFEVCCALAFVHFAEAGVDWAVVEAGLGGRLDATNVVRPRLSVITNVDMDHEAFLGRDIASIAAEKGGILKQGTPLITGATGDALRILKALSHEKQVPVSVIGEDYHIMPDVNGMRLAHPGGEAHYDVQAAGEHALDNAAIAVAACDALRASGADVPIEAVQQALAQTSVPGRMETLHHDGIRCILDGAHNLAAAHALRHHLGRIQVPPFHLIVGFAADKPWPAMLDQWAPLATHIWGVPLRSPRSLDPGRIQERVPVGVPFQACHDFEDAFQQAKDAGATDAVVAGSLWLVGEARAWLTGQDMEDIGGDQ